MSEKYIFDFDKKIEIKNPLRVFFLCGSKYHPFNKGKKAALKDKRNVLSKYIKKKYKNKNYKPLILEENFIFTDKSGKSKKIKYVDDLKLSSLKDIELIVSMLSDQIFIIHETISTAAELGLFSYNRETSNKITVLNPNPDIVRENFISGFLYWAYDNEDCLETKVNIIQYDPKTKIIKTKFFNKNYTYFPSNKISAELGEDIQKPLKYLEKIKLNSLQKKKTRTPSQNYYYVLNKKGTVVFTIDTVKLLILALLNQKKTINSINKALKYRFIDSSKYKKRDAMFKISDVLFVLLTRYSKNYIIASNEKIKKIEIKIKGSYYNLYQFVHFYIYMLSIFDYIKLPTNIKPQNCDNYMEYSNDFKDIIKEYKQVIKKTIFNIEGEF